MMKSSIDVEELKDNFWEKDFKSRVTKWIDKINESTNMKTLFLEMSKILNSDTTIVLSDLDDNFLKVIIKKLVCVEKCDMDKLIKKLEREVSGEKENKKIKYIGDLSFEDNSDEISNFFLDEYSSLSSRVFITDYIRQNFTVCPYCNATYLFDLKQRSARGGSESNDYFADQLDHYHPKGKYPYLAMSIFNLIPSCPTCNHIKGSKENHLHPYTEEMGDNAKFTLSMSCLGELEGINFETEKEYRNIMEVLDPPTELNFDLEEGFSKRVELKIKKDIDDDLKDRIENSEEIFQLENKYSGVREEIRDLYFKYKLLNQSQREETLSQFGDSLGITAEEMEEVYYGARKEHKHKRPLSKFINDIRDFLKNED